MRLILSFIAARRKNHNYNEEISYELGVRNLILETGKYLSMWKDKCNKFKHEQREPGRPRKKWKFNFIFVFNEVLSIKTLGGRRRYVLLL
jgi:hypothetical protein